MSTPTVASSLVPEIHVEIEASKEDSQPEEKKLTCLRLEMPQFTADIVRDTIGVFRRAKQLSLLKIHGSSSVSVSEIQDALKAQNLHPMGICFQRGRIQLVEAVVGEEDGSIFKVLLFLIQSRDGKEEYRYYCVRGEQAKIDFRQGEIAKWIKRDQVAACDNQ